jgi:hypothetical protein
MAAASFTPLDAPLFPIPDDPIFTQSQWETLLSLSDVVVPALTTETTSKALYQKTVSAKEFDSTLATLTAQTKAPDAAQIALQYLSENASSNPQFKEALRRTVLLYVPQESKKGLSLVLNALK